MSAKALKRLTVSCLRGAASSFTLTFEKNKPLTIVYGENATGKSTICDALEFIGAGTVGSLDDKGLGKTGRYWHTMGKKSTDIAVTLETSESVCTAALHKGVVVVTPQEQRPRVRVLRRVQILSLLNAMPAQRYANIRHFIDVAEVEQAERNLSELATSLRTGFATAVTRIQENRDAIQQFWEEAGKPGANSLVWCASEVTKNQEAIDDEISRLERARGGYVDLQKAVQNCADTAARVKLASEQRKVADQEYLACAETLASGAPDIVRMLDAARAYLAHHPEPSECPLCESSERVKDLADRVNGRIAGLARLQAARARLDASTRAEEMEQLAAATAAAGMEAAGAGLGETMKEGGWQKGESLPPVPAKVPPDEWGSWLNGTASIAAKWTAAIATKRGSEALAGSLKRAHATLLANTTTAVDLERLLPRVEAALKVLADERRAFTDATLSRIAVEVGRLYEEVHPGEGLSKISLELDPAKRASLEIAATFGGEDGTPPQAYFSDSHLDTLGLCMFLALAALEDQAGTILVLDDVLASVDEPHVDRLIEMLYREAHKFRHCVITTHYRPWKQKLRWGWLQNGQCQFVELAKWTGVGGLTLIKSVPDFARLRQLLQETPPDPQLICSKAGVILEAALDFLTQLYECRVPRRPEARYTLGDLLPSLSKKLIAALKVEVLSSSTPGGAAVYTTIALAPILNELTRIAQARNVFGAHFSELSFSLLDTDALGFGQQVLALMDALTDPDAGWPKGAKSGSYWATAGETRRLHPLREPQ